MPTTKPSEIETIMQRIVDKPTLKAISMLKTDGFEIEAAKDVPELKGIMIAFQNAIEEKHAMIEHRYAEPIGTFVRIASTNQTKPPEPVPVEDYLAAHCS